MRVVDNRSMARRELWIDDKLVVWMTAEMIEQFRNWPCGGNSGEEAFLIRLAKMPWGCNPDAN